MVVGLTWRVHILNTSISSQYILECKYIHEIQNFDLNNPFFQINIKNNPLFHLFSKVTYFQQKKNSQNKWDANPIGAYVQHIRGCINLIGDIVQINASYVFVHHQFDWHLLLCVVHKPQLDWRLIYFENEFLWKMDYFEYLFKKMSYLDKILNIYFYFYSLFVLSHNKWL